MEKNLLIFLLRLRLSQQKSIKFSWISTHPIRKMSNFASLECSSTHQLSTKWNFLKQCRHISTELANKLIRDVLIIVSVFISFWISDSKLSNSQCILFEILIIVSPVAITSLLFKGHIRGALFCVGYAKALYSQNNSLYQILEWMCPEFKTVPSISRYRSSRQTAMNFLPFFEQLKKFNWLLISDLDPHFKISMHLT